MKNLIFYLISIVNNAKKCRHTRALLNSNEGYCPDCGVYLKKYYYVLRCSCCSHKREASRAVLGKYDKITPVSKFCPICGGEEFYIEKYEKLNITDVNYAIEVKEILPQTAQANYTVSSTKVWVETPEADFCGAKDEAPFLIQGTPLKSLSLIQ